jgi:hypothetical protein
MCRSDSHAIRCREVFPVTWQDELRQLDEELAAGRLSAEDYRRQRDELLSQTASSPSGTGDPSGSASTPPGGQQAGGQSGPFPPPFRWDQSPAEATQRIGPARNQANGGSETTKVGREQAGNDAERTQVVRGGPRQPGRPEGAMGRGMPPGPPGPPWAQSEQAPPWDGTDLPATTDTTPAWFKQGPEVFESDGGGSGVLRILGVVAIVLLLVSISVGAYYFFRPDASTGAGRTTTVAAPTSSQPAAQTTTSTKPEGLPIAELPGTATDTSRVKTFADVEAVGYLTNQEIDEYRKSKAGKSSMAISSRGDVRIIVLVTQQADASGAKQTRDALHDLQLRFKLGALPAQQGVLSAGIDNTDPGPLRRAHYASARFVVRIQVQGADKAEVDRLYSEVLSKQLSELPADA